jgi:hypothetical protein
MTTVRVQIFPQAGSMFRLEISRGSEKYLKKVILWTTKLTSNEFAEFLRSLRLYICGLCIKS